MKKLAKVIMLAAKIREDSYDHEASTKAFRKAVVKKEIVDFREFYKETIYTAAQKASEQCALDDIVAQSILLLLLSGNWDEIVDWAESVLENETIIDPESFKYNM